MLDVASNTTGVRDNTRVVSVQRQWNPTATYDFLSSTVKKIIRFNHVLYNIFKVLKTWASSFIFNSKPLRAKIKAEDDGTRRPA